MGKKDKAYRIVAPDFDHTSEDMSETLIEYGFQQGEMGRMFGRMTRAKFEKDNSEARLFLIFKDEIDENTNRPLNNDTVKMSVIDDPSQQELVEEYNEARIKYETQLGIVKQLEMKLEILRTVEASKRAEMNNQLA